jgi:hypothetical protein
MVADPPLNGLPLRAAVDVTAGTKQHAVRTVGREHRRT